MKNLDLTQLAKLFPKDLKIKMADGKMASLKPITLGTVMKIEKKFGSLQELAKVFDMKNLSVSKLVEVAYLLIKETDVYKTAEEFAENIDLESLAEIIEKLADIVDRDVLAKPATDVAAGGDGAAAPAK